jgi:hypothetical protein
MNDTAERTSADPITRERCCEFYESHPRWHRALAQAPPLLLRPPDPILRVSRAARASACSTSAAAPATCWPRSARRAAWDRRLGAAMPDARDARRAAPLLEGDAADPELLAQAAARSTRSCSSTWSRT